MKGLKLVIVGAVMFLSGIYDTEHGHGSSGLLRTIIGSVVMTAGLTTKE